MQVKVVYIVIRYVLRAKLQNATSLFYRFFLYINNLLGPLKSVARESFRLLVVFKKCALRRFLFLEFLHWFCYGYCFGFQLIYGVRYIHTIVLYHDSLWNCLKFNFFKVELCFPFLIFQLFMTWSWVSLFVIVFLSKEINMKKLEAGNSCV